MTRGMQTFMCFLMALVAAAIFPVHAAETASAPQDVDVVAEAEIPTAPVEIDGRLLFRVRGVTSFPSEERAKAIRRRIEGLAADPAFIADALSIADEGAFAGLMAGTLRIMVVTDADAHVEQVSRSTLAIALRDRIVQAIEKYRADRSREYLIRAASYAAAATVALVLAMTALIWLARRLEALVMRRLHGRIRSLGFQSFEIVRAQHLRLAIEGLLRALRVVIGFTFAFTYLSWVLHLFPWTRGAGDHLFESVANPLLTMGAGLLHIIPDLFFLVILALIARVAIKIVRLFFDAVEQGNVKLAAFEPEWALPTYKLVRIAIVAFALIVAYPYIPGSSSAAFKGISLFAGVLLSLGSSSAIANIIAGYMITYRRAFKVGDRVQIGETVGDVIEMRLQVTHVRTLKNEEVVVPNSLILNNQVTNFTSFAATKGLILHTVVGIGYETPWRQVEAMLLVAASRTKSLLSDPAPFILQTKLDDFAINYELNAYCNDAYRVPRTYTELHRNILDVFNEYGVAIMTPAYVADPDEPKMVPRAKWFEAPGKDPDGAAP